MAGGVVGSSSGGGGGLLGCDANGKGRLVG